MTSKFKKTIAITCLFSLLVASIALAENENATRRGGARGSRGNRGEMMAPGGNRAMDAPGAMRGSRGMGGPGSMAMGRERGMGQKLIPMGVKQKLKLTDEQNKKLETAQNELNKKVQAAVKKHEELRKKLDDAVSKGDKEAVVSVAQEMGKAIGESALLKISEKDVLKEILNEEQLNTVEDYNKKRLEMREKMRKQMQERMQNRGQGPQRGKGPARERTNRQTGPKRNR